MDMMSWDYKTKQNIKDLEIRKLEIVTMSVYICIYLQKLTILILMFVFFCIKHKFR